MGAITLQSLAKELKEIKSLLLLNDWFAEEDGTQTVGISKEVLRKMRNKPEHSEGWRYMEGKNGTDSKNRTIRRNIQWSRTYINGLFKKVNAA